jgi:hypothetical protein
LNKGSPFGEALFSGNILDAGHFSALHRKAFPDTDMKESWFIPIGKVLTLHTAKAVGFLSGERPQSISVSGNPQA